MTFTESTKTARGLASTSCLLLTLLSSGGVLADENHYSDYLVGERALGMGGAFTAISDDASGAFYNPAGLAEASENELNLSMSLYGWVGTDQSTLDTAGAVASQSSSFVTYPTTSGWLRRIRDGDPDGAGRMQAALTIINPSSSVGRRPLTYFEATVPQGLPPYDVTPFSASQVVAEDESLWLGLSYAWKPTRFFSLGLTLFGTMRTGLYQFYDIEAAILTNPNDPDFLEVATLPTRTELNAKNFGGLAQLGVMLRFTEALTLGLTARTPEAAFLRSGELGIFSATTNDTGVVIESLEASAEFKPQRPWRFATGLAYVVDRRWGVSVDFAFYTAIGPHAILEGELDDGTQFALIELEKKAVWQLNVGAEYFVLDALSLRLGVFTNRSSFVDCDPASDACLDPLNPFVDPADRYGVAGSVSYDMSQATLTFGASYNVGSTDLTTRDGIDVSSQSSFLAFTLGGSLRFED